MTWKRVKDCKSCGRPGCMVNSENEKMGYCFRYGKTFFLNDGKIHFSGSAQKKEKQKTCDNQESFDFGKNQMLDYEQ